MLKLISSIAAAAAVAAGGTYYATATYFQKTTVVEVPDLYTSESSSRILQKLDSYLDRELARLDAEDARRAAVPAQKVPEWKSWTK